VTNVWISLLTGASFLGVFLAIAVATRAGDGRTRLWLTILLAVTAAFVAEFLLAWSGVYSQPVVFVTYPLFFLLGPALWILSRRVSGAPEPSVALHLVPALVMAVNLAPYYGAILTHGLRETPGQTVSGMGGYGMMIVQLIHTGAYVIVSMRYMDVYQRGLRRDRSDGSVLRAAGLRPAAAALAAVIVVEIVAALTMKLARHHVDAAEYGMAFAFAGVILVLAWILFRQPAVFDAPVVPAAKYQRSSLDPQRLDEHARRLRDLFETERPWLDAELRLSTLARRVQVPPHHLSQVFSQAFGTTFFDFVNAYRVREAARQLLREGERGKTVLAIALDSGFSSKASFNRVFKSRLGMTPSEFRSDGTEEHAALRDLLPDSTRNGTNAPQPTG
jgi:AraC-like DNA-binding protein